ncbi:T-cell immunoglobulin and mucin domain-containing protein 4-like [Sinocyclocheilus anshuiensis]|uniref:T-cell immunoglobulin and mucin domain-containing protein 4-like n=1 Tax=Sinocyclocheilus anshuiensis TaxID=1608454 RepID=UPI0007B8AB04|nr:PREDICTED: T-cell immunoglobulin and mucin domain-containing protein 4-like [Sinocyclocheilus anshuiensis]
MTDFHSWFFASWILCYLTISKCSNGIVQSFEGESVILPRKYDSKYHGKCPICWMIGDIPNMGCGNEIIGSDGDKVVRKKSYRYQLEGEIRHGDVSLTILNIQKTDSGKYGCRIHVPGLFNDEMYYVHLIVNDETSFDHRESSSVENKDSVNASAVIVPVLLLLLALIVIAVILILKHKKKTRAAVDITQNSENSVIYSNSGSSVGLYNREMAVENIYQIQPENEYEH